MSNSLEQVDLSWCDLYQHESIWNLCDSKLQNFCAQNFQLQNYFPAQNFQTFVASKVFTLIFFCVMSQKTTVGKIRHPSDGAKDVEASLPGTSNL